MTIGARWHNSAAKKYGLDSQAKGAAFYGVSEDDLRWAWDQYHKGFPVGPIVSQLARKSTSWFPRRLSLKKLVVEWQALGLPVWAFARRGKIRREAQRLLAQFQERFDMPLPATVFAALKFADIQGADLRSVVETEFGAAPKRPRNWAEREFGKEYVLKMACP